MEGFREALQQEIFLVVANYQSVPACEDGQQNGHVAGLLADRGLVMALAASLLIKVW